ncbi:MAG: bifunctional pyr operon transcriptional regulator/uracil phosphoribosyltransferase PyrR [Pseudomonadota bacterium]|nr:bifunctional pyr operon transcriptional regulator/uracil phosphoribosyltransferase PyrR [Pseudomonadota bacterium]
MILRDANAVHRLITNMAEAIAERYRNEPEPLLIGIHTGGLWVASELYRLLAEPLRLSDPLGSLDISFYRDDFARIGVHPEVKPSHLPFSVDEREIILVDDVLYTGRTVRAAMNEIFDYGRPAAIRLAVLIDRNGRELPIAADVVGEHYSPAPDEHIKLIGPSPLEVRLKHAHG